MFSGSTHAITTAAMDYDALPDYFEKMNFLKRKYADQIRILIGFEFDYIDGCQEWTKSQLLKYGDLIDDAILSVHFLPTDQGLRAVDDDFDDFCDGVLKYYKTPVGVARKYLSTVLEAVKWQCENKPFRYGHITLYRKWRKCFPEETVWDDHRTKRLFDKILKRVSRQNDMLDCNMSGLAKFTQCESSPYVSIIERANEQGIKLVYGSDAHDSSNIDRILGTKIVSVWGEVMDLTVHDGRPLRICQLTDIHLGSYPFGESDLKTLSSLRRLFTQKKFHLIMITGDIIWGKDNSTARESLAVFYDFLNSLKTPVAITYGNHDVEGPLKRSDMRSMEKKLEFLCDRHNNFLNSNRESYTLEVHNRDSGELQHVIYVWDSGSYTHWPKIDD